MKVVVDGTTYQWDGSRMLFSEAAFVQQRTKLRLFEWQAALGEFDAFAVKALVYLVKKRNNELVDWDALDFDLASVEFIPDPDEVDEDAAPKEGTPAATPSGTVTS